MTLDEAIKHAEEVAKEHEQLAEWLKELKRLREQNNWIPVSERLPNKPDLYTVTDSKGDVVRFIFCNDESSREYWLRCAKAWMHIEPYREDDQLE